MRDIRFINFARGLTSRAESNRDRSGGCFARPKQWVSGFFEPFTFDALGLLSNLPRLERNAGGGSKDRCTRRAASSVSSGAAYHDYIASILRDAFGGERRSRTGRSLRTKETEGSASE